MTRFDWFSMRRQGSLSCVKASICAVALWKRQPVRQIQRSPKDEPRRKEKCCCQRRRHRHGKTQAGLAQPGAVHDEAPGLT